MPPPVKRGPMKVVTMPIMGSMTKGNRKAPMPRERKGFMDTPIKGSGPKAKDSTKSMGQAGRVTMAPKFKGSMSTASMPDVRRKLDEGNQQASTSGGRVPGVPNGEKPGGPKAV